MFKANIRRQRFFDAFGMYDNFLTALDLETESYAFMNKEQDTVIGWCLLRFEGDSSRRPAIDVYVSAKRRKEGIGSKLMKEAVSFSKTKFKSAPKAVIHDETSNGFYIGHKDHLRIFDERS